MFFQCLRGSLPVYIHLKFDFFFQEHERIMTVLVRSSNFSKKSLLENFHEITDFELYNSISAYILPLD